MSVNTDLPNCPICGETMTLSGPLMKVPICLNCYPPKVKLAPGKRKHDYVATVYHTQKTMEARIARQPTEQELIDAVLDAKNREQLKQCKHCTYSCFIGGNLFCDYVSYAGHSRTKGEGPGDCRSFHEKNDEATKKACFLPDFFWSK